VSLGVLLIDSVARLYENCSQDAHPNLAFGERDSVMASESMKRSIALFSSSRLVLLKCQHLHQFKESPMYLTT